MNNKIKICIIIKGFHNGGIERVTENYFCNMDRNGFDLHIITHITTNKERRKRFEEMGFTIHDFTNFRGSRIGIRNYREYSELFKKEKFDIVHNNSVQNLLPLFVAKQQNINVRILHSHADFDSAIADRSWLARLLYRGALKLNVCNATTLYSCGEIAGKSVFGKKEFDKGNVEIIPNAIDTNSFRFNQNTRKRIRDQWNIDEDEIVIGNVGRFEDDLKNQDFIIDIAKCLLEKRNAVRIVLVGDGHLRTQIEEKAGKLGISEKVLFTGAIDNVNEALNAFDFFLFPSKTEGLSMSVVEAQCNGLKGIMTDTLPTEMNIIGTFVTMSLSRTALEWAEEILRNLDYKREDQSDNIRQVGYDIKAAANTLREKYIKLTNDKNK